MRKLACLTLAAAAVAGCGAPGPNVAPEIDETQAPIVRGETEAGFPQVVLVEARLNNGGRLRCSGTYIGSRLVLTAAHCTRPGLLSPNGVFVYYGDDYATDVAQVPAIPPPGQPSVWARSDSWETHPDYQPALNYPDLAVIYLDRELPFDPLPLFPGPVTDRWVGKQAEVVGWGASRALTPDLSEVEGLGVKRSGLVTILGSPTEADFHPDDPNAGLLDPAIRADEIKLNGQDPSPNPCAGDSGGPMILTRHGVSYLAGVGFWVGLSCEDYSIFTRLDPFRKFIHDALERAGRLPIVPRLQCLDHRADGSLRAYFAYENENGISMTIPYGKHTNDLPLDTAGARPSQFLPGDHPWAFGVSFPADQRLKYKLSSPQGGTTVLQVDKRTPPACTAGVDLACAHACDAQLAADCGFDQPASLFESCVAGCIDNLGLFPTCAAEWTAYNECIGGLSPDAGNWFCDPDFPPAFPADTVCVDEVNSLVDCIFAP